MPVKIRIYATLRERVKWDSKNVELRESEVTLLELLEEISDLKKAMNDIGLENFIILVNGHNIMLLQGLETKVKEGDTVDIFPQAAGGI